MGNQMTENNGSVVEVRPDAHTTQIEAVRAAAEVQGAITVARQFPRNEDAAYQKMKSACGRYSFAKKATFSFPRGKEKVSGGTIRLLEAIALRWGNMQYGFRELSRDDDKKCSVVEAFAWDVETNVRNARAFEARWGTDTKYGFKEAKSSRDIYEAVANYAQRRVRACLEAIIPEYIRKDMEEECRKTMLSGGGVSFEERKLKLIDAFSSLRINVEMLEKKLGHGLDTISDEELVDLREIYNAIKNEPSSRADFFGGGPSPATVTIDKSVEDVPAMLRTLRKNMDCSVAEAQDFFESELGGDVERLKKEIGK